MTALPPPPPPPFPRATVSAMVATRTDPELREMFSRIHQFDMAFFNNNSAAQVWRRAA